jgi:beta-N-acetylhexosaminidase
VFSLGQLFIIGIEGTDVSPDEVKFIQDNKIGGVILFTRNYENPSQLFDLCQRLQSLAPKDGPPMLIGVDMEGGRVHRLKEPYTQWPAVKNLGIKNSPSLAFSFAQSMGFELAATGINLNFAPCIDILTNEQNTVIGDRSLGNDVDLVSKLSSALVRGYIKSGVLPCAKHFPGHGNTIVDSHEDLPREKTTLEILKQREFEVFKKAIRARLNFIMTSHILFEDVDPENPVTFSKTFLKDFLRGELRYYGAVVTDDLDMGALRKHYEREEIPVKALNSGCDVLLYCNEPDSPRIAYEAIKKAVADGKVDLSTVVESYQRIDRIKKSLKVPELNKEDLLDLLNSKKHQEIVSEVLTA